MTICTKCGQHLLDKGGWPHNCPGNQVQKIVYNYYPPALTPMRIKCDICGSTAIDHTEAQCALNKLNKKLEKEL